MKNKKNFLNFLVIGVLICVCMIAIFAIVLHTNNSKTMLDYKFSKLQLMIDDNKNTSNRLYTMIVERDHMLEEQQRLDYNDLSLRFRNMEFINPYAPMADCLKIGPLDGPNFSLECQKK
jgi:hypothetical protein